MAAKKKAVKKKAAKKSKSKELATITKNKSVVNYKERMASMAKTDSARGHKMGESNVISTQGGILSHQETELPNPLYVVITDFTYENAHYTGVYDSDNPAPPACFAVGDDPDDLAPHETSPVMQVAAGDPCEGCEMNEYGTSATGKGKGCKNGARLFVLNAMNVKEELDLTMLNAASEPSLLRVAPTSLKHFEKYKGKITKVLGKPLLGVVTEIELVPFKTWHELHFSFVEELDDDQMLQNMLSVHDTYEDTLREPYDVTGYTESPRKNVRRGASKKKAVKKAVKKKAVKKKSKY